MDCVCWQFSTSFPANRRTWFFPASMPAAIWVGYYLFGHRRGGHGRRAAGYSGNRSGQVRVYGEMSLGGVEHHGRAIVRKLLREKWPHNVLMNVNFPDLPAAQVGKDRDHGQGRRKIGDAVTTGRDPGVTTTCGSARNATKIRYSMDQT